MMHGLMDENNHYNSPRLYVKAYGMDELPYVFGLKPLKPMDEKNEFLSTVRGNQTKVKNPESCCLGCHNTKYFPSHY